MPGMLEFIGSLRIGHDWAIELNWELSKENHQQNEKATNLHNGRKYLQNHMADGGVSIEKYKEHCDKLLVFLSIFHTFNNVFFALIISEIYIIRQEKKKI